MGLHLNRRLVLEEAVRSPDGAGGAAEVWTELGVLWGAVRPGNGRGAAGQGVALGLTPLEITVRAAPFGAPSRPKAGQRFREGGARLFEILAVTEDDPTGRYLTCHAREEVAR